MPLVSVLTATWNQSAYLREALDSAMAQTYRDIELVVVDDGSTDDTPEVCASYGDRIRYFRHENDNTGGATALALAFKMARGDYLAVLDHDDRWLPQKLERQVQALEAWPEAGAAFTRCTLIDSAGASLGPWDMTAPSGDVFHVLLRANRYCMSSSLLRRSVIEKVGHHDTSVQVGDWDMWLRIAREHPIIMIEEFLTEYRVHGDNYSRNRRKMANGSRQVLERHRPHLHPGCRECLRSHRAGMALAARAFMDHFHESARKGELRAAFPSLRDATATSPAMVLRPRALLAIAKTFLLAPLAVARSARAPRR
jgi:glycosyltransferase involved in cell wall biosynthesis